MVASVAIWRKQREPREPDYEAFDQMIAPGGGWALAVLRVTGADRPSEPNARHDRCNLAGVLHFDYHPPTAVEEYVSMPTSKWLRAGDEVAVLVELSKLQAGKQGAVRIIWERLAERGTPGIQQARAEAARLRGEPFDPETDLYRAAGVVGDPDRPLPGTSGGGTTPQQANALVDDGTRATATVVAAVDVPIPRLLRAIVPGGGPPVDLTLDINRPDGTTHRVRTRIGFSTPERRARVAQVGATLPVRLDPTDPDKIAIDTVALGFA